MKNCLLNPIRKKSLINIFTEHIKKSKLKKNYPHFYPNQHFGIEKKLKRVAQVFEDCNFFYVATPQGKSLTTHQIITATFQIFRLSLSWQTLS